MLLPSTIRYQLRNYGGQGRKGKRQTTYASLWPCGMLASTFLISWAPKPVAVRLCFGLVKPGPTGPLSSEIGALVDGFLVRVEVAIGSEGRREGGSKMAKTNGDEKGNGGQTEMKKMKKMKKMRNQCPASPIILSLALQL